MQYIRHCTSLYGRMFLPVLGHAPSWETKGGGLWHWPHPDPSGKFPQCRLATPKELRALGRQNRGLPGSTTFAFLPCDCDAQAHQTRQLSTPTREKERERGREEEGGFQRPTGATWVGAHKRTALNPKSEIREREGGREGGWGGGRGERGLCSAWSICLGGSVV